MKFITIGVLLLLTAVCSLVSCRDQLSAGRPVPVIFDTDMATDCDDAGALAMLHTLLNVGEPNCWPHWAITEGSTPQVPPAPTMAGTGRRGFPVAPNQASRVAGGPLDTRSGVLEMR